MFLVEYASPDSGTKQDPSDLCLALVSLNSVKIQGTLCKSKMYLISPPFNKDDTLYISQDKTPCVVCWMLNHEPVNNPCIGEQMTCHKGILMSVQMSRFWFLLPELCPKLFKLSWVINKCMTLVHCVLITHVI